MPYCSLRKTVKLECSSCVHARWGKGGGYSLIWPIQGCAAGQGMVFVLSVLNRVYNFARVCPKQGQFPFKSVQNSLHDLRECVCTFKKQ